MNNIIKYITWPYNTSFLVYFAVKKNKLKQIYKLYKNNNFGFFVG